jgi:hypothetical protein
MFRDFLPFFEMIIIKLAISRPRHFLGSHLYQQFYTNATAHLGQPSFNANQCWLSLPVDVLEEFKEKKTLARSQNQLNPVCSLMLKSKNPQKHNRIDYLHNRQGRPIWSNKSCWEIAINNPPTLTRKFSSAQQISNHLIYPPWRHGSPSMRPWILSASTYHTLKLFQCWILHIPIANLCIKETRPVPTFSNKLIHWKYFYYLLYSLELWQHVKCPRKEMALWNRPAFITSAL